MIPRLIEPVPRGWPSRGSKLLAIVAAVVGFALLVIALLGGFLLPVAKGCSAAFASQAVVTDACHDAAVAMDVVWLAFFVVGGGGAIFALVRTYFSLRPQTSVSHLAGQASFAFAQQKSPFSPRDAVGHGAAWVPGPGSHPWSDDGAAVQPLPQRPRRWPYITAIVVLALGVVVFGSGYAYSTNSANQWRATADKTSLDLSSMTAERDGLSEKITSLNSQLSTTNSKLNDTTSQLNDANGRIRSLANEKAQLGDNTAFLTELVAASQKVSTEMSTCIRDLQKLQTYLVNSNLYDQASLISVARGVNSECNTARSDSDALTKTIQGLGK